MSNASPRTIPPEEMEDGYSDAFCTASLSTAAMQTVGSFAAAKEKEAGLKPGPTVISFRSYFQNLPNLPRPQLEPQKGYG